MAGAGGSDPEGDSGGISFFLTGVEAYNGGSISSKWTGQGGVVITGAGSQDEERTLAEDHPD